MAGARRPLVSGPGYSGESQGLSAEERAIAAAEAQAPKAVMGQSVADDFYKEMAAKGMEESGIPKDIFLGASVDPDDIQSPSPKKFVGRSGMRERFGTDMAIGRVGPELARKYGLDLSTHVPKFCLMDRYGGNGGNFEQDWLADNPDGEICTDSEGKKYNMQGLILCKLPREVQEEIDRDNASQSESDRKAAMERGDRLPADPDQVAKLREQSAAAVNALLRGSPTSSVDLDVALNRYTPEETKKVEDEFRYAFSARRSTDQAAMANAADRVVQQTKAAAAGRSSHAIGASFDANGNVVRA